MSTQEDHIHIHFVYFVLILCFILCCIFEYMRRYASDIFYGFFKFLYEIFVFLAKIYIFYMCIISIVTVIKIDLKSKEKMFSIEDYHSNNLLNTDTSRFNDVTFYKFKKNLLVYKFDEIYDSSSINKFANLNNFINMAIYRYDNNNTEIAFVLSSGGGSSLLFEKSYSSVKRLQNYGFKTYALIDTICASGCYMLACGCSEIIAGNHSTIGSIGVFTKRYNGGELADKIGIKELIIKSSEIKGDIPFFGNYSKNELDHIQKKVNATMKKFTSIVIDNRPNVSMSVFNADTMYAELALPNGLIDKVQMSDDFILEKINKYNILIIDNFNDHTLQNSHKKLMGLFDKMSSYFDQT